MIFAVNILQFIFLSLKLDNIVEWSWVVCNQCIIVLIYLCIIDIIYNKLDHGEYKIRNIMWDGLRLGVEFLT